MPRFDENRRGNRLWEEKSGVLVAGLTIFMADRAAKWSIPGKMGSLGSVFGSVDQKSDLAGSVFKEIDR